MKGRLWKVYRKAAEQGLAEAQYLLGFIHDKGKEKEQNLRKAKKWYKKAAKEGHIEAQFNLAVLYVTMMKEP